MPIRHHVRAAFVVGALLAVAPPAAADLTLFAGPIERPDVRPVTGGALGLSLVIIGVEFEYASSGAHRPDAIPGLQTGMFNLLLQTPFGALAGFQLYGTAGGGLYRERLDGAGTTDVGSNVGGGVKIALAGPLRLRLDYRVFALRGDARHRRPQRVYAGLNLAF